MGKTKFDFSGQVAVVSGAAKGIGRGSAEAFAEAGARVYVVDLDEKLGEAVAQGIREKGGKAAFLACDVMDSKKVKAAIDKAGGEAGRIDILVNSAGGFWQQLTVEETSEEEWDKVVDLNLKSIFLTCKFVIPYFKKQNYGRIVNIGSMAGLSIFPGALSSPPYSAAKAGIHSLTRVLAVELGPYGVTANAIAPGTTATERVVAVRNEAQRAQIGKSTLVGRIAQVSDMVGWVLFLCSPEGAYFTGQTVAVNGGRYLH
ncbi:MAG: SDR family oxidoreductase [Candidatus Tectomicrobia bacterium]|uniref:SDR family oxidoreductase n=1 Tax=Tectimicrobiota bacterium TaxID=2528274 RepID=A0A932HYT2_UNCTE|nr:SDR family oxidoreductase [Candidatus Tectomicrobia bacterium]